MHKDLAQSGRELAAVLEKLGQHERAAKLLKGVEEFERRTLAGEELAVQLRNAAHATKAVYDQSATKRVLGAIGAFIDKHGKSPLRHIGKRRTPAPPGG